MNANPRRMHGVYGYTDCVLKDIAVEVTSFFPDEGFECRFFKYEEAI